MIKMQATTNLEIAKINAEAKRYATQRKADADLIDAQKRAEGELLVKTAEARGEKMRNEAMTGVGGSTIVALEAAKNLQLKEATFSTMNVDLLDVDKMVEKFGASKE